MTYPVKADGGLAEAIDGAQRMGKGANQRRHDGPHAHCVMLDSAVSYAFAPDLGLDKLFPQSFIIPILSK